jgi:transposase InsO family protein
MLQGFSQSGGNKFRKKVKVLRSDNGTEYTNSEMQDFLRGNDIVHQTTYVSTAKQNDIAKERIYTFWM